MGHEGNWFINLKTHHKHHCVVINFSVAKCQSKKSDVKWSGEQNHTELTCRIIINISLYFYISCVFMAQNIEHLMHNVNVWVISAKHRQVWSQVSKFLVFPKINLEQFIWLYPFSLALFFQSSLWTSDVRKFVSVVSYRRHRGQYGTKVKWLQKHFFQWNFKNVCCAA